MYETFFGLQRRPFASAPDPNCFVPVQTMQAALDALVVSTERSGGIALLTAAPGLGKTVLCQRLATELAEQFYPVLLTTANFPTRGCLLQAILFELEHPYRQMTEQELRLALLAALRQAQLDKRQLLLIIDEAHLLNSDVLEEIRTLTNWVENGEPLVRVVLSGQLPLEEMLTAPEFEAINQRVSCHVTLEPLTQQESADYVRWRVEWAGSTLDTVFTPEAMRVICYASDGVPRCLNHLCDHSLLLAFVAEQKPVEAVTVREALEDLKQLPLHWREPTWMEPAIHHVAESAAISAGQPEAENPPEFETPVASSETATSEVAEALPPGRGLAEDRRDEAEDRGEEDVFLPKTESSSSTPAVACIEVGAPEESCHGFDQPPAQTDIALADPACDYELLETDTPAPEPRESAADVDSSPAVVESPGLVEAPAVIEFGSEGIDAHAAASDHSETPPMSSLEPSSKPEGPPERSWPETEPLYGAPDDSSCIAPADVAFGPGDMTDVDPERSSVESIDAAVIDTEPAGTQPEVVQTSQEDSAGSVPATDTSTAPTPADKDEFRHHKQQRPVADAESIAADEEEFVEEVVEDRYAALDAMAELPEGFGGIVWEIGSKPSSSQQPAASSDSVCEEADTATSPEGSESSIDRDDFSAAILPDETSAADGGLGPELSSADEAETGVEADSGPESTSSSGTAAEEPSSAESALVQRAEPDQPSQQAQTSDPAIEASTHEPPLYSDPRPDLVVEEMLPLITASTEGWISVETTPLADRSDIAAVPSSGGAEEDTGDIEEQIGQAVLNMCVDTREALAVDSGTDCAIERLGERPDDSAADSHSESSSATGPAIVSRDPSGPTCEAEPPTAADSDQCPSHSDAASSASERPAVFESGYGDTNAADPDDLDIVRAPRGEPAQPPASSSEPPDRPSSSERAAAEAAVHSGGHTASSKRPYAHLFSELRRRQSIGY
ncbi:MAG: AAA family ATPase [Planctomycetes bacterium]|nr:AAA family ATPase [Planctomycetota bacterium]